MTMRNSGSFKSIDKGTIAPSYSDGTKIYLESTDDQYILRQWFATFNFQDKLSFESVSKSRGDGGCQLVLKKVKDSELKSFGIVDRDILLSASNFRDSLWWEIDDETFTSKMPYGENIFVLHRWELENYLFHPQALASLVADKKLDAAVSAAEIADLLCDHEDEMVSVTLLSVIPAKTIDSQVSEQFGREKSGMGLMAEIQNKLQVQPGVVASEKVKISSFSENETDPVSRWHKLSRMLDGKRIMHRIGDLLSSDKKDNIKLELERGALAGHIAKHKLIDRALTHWLEEVYRSA